MTISNLKPFMAYLTFDQYARLKRFASKNDVPMAQVIRESIDARIAAGDRYSHGYNTALKDAMRSVAENKAARMRFPSGKSFADLVNEDLQKLLIKENQHETQKERDARQHEAGEPAQSAGSEGQGDPDLGL
jgi:hypothetical protein